MGTRRIVVIGGVAAGPKAAARARRVDPEAEITLLERGSLISYGSCGLPLYLAGLVALESLRSTPAGVLRDEDFFWREKRVRVLTGTGAEEIDPARHVVWARSGGERFAIGYDSLVLATGAVPVMPPVIGLDEEGVFRLHRPEEAEALRRALAPRRRAVVVGGGLVGLEVADALATRRLQVTVCEAGEHLLPGLLDTDMARVLETHLGGQGLTVVTGQPVTAIRRSNGGLRVEAPDWKGEADLVVVACGVRPEVSLAARAGLEIGPTGAIAVDGRQATGVPDIFAAGDCCQATHLVTGEKTWLPLASTANKQGRVAGTNAAGGEEHFPGVVGTAVLQVAESNVARTGLGEGEALRMGYQAVGAVVAGFDAAHYYPMHAPLALKVVADARDGRLLGAQAVGPGEAVKRVDVLATAISCGATLDRVAHLDLGYAPPFATALDICLSTLNQLRNRLDGLARPVAATELKALLGAPRPPLVLDVRTPAEYEGRRLPYPALHVPLAQLRDRLDEVRAARAPGQEIVAVCEMGVRGFEAQRLLDAAGLGPARYLEGGIWAWPYGLQS
ncbi:MAG: FAD-dependent oxidoreductase [Bacillota bacterium]|nr:FAD-dependent oxidoreductase [Bacillota bacterium]